MKRSVLLVYLVFFFAMGMFPALNALAAPPEAGATGETLDQVAGSRQAPKVDDLSFRLPELRELRSELELDGARPMALTSGDFDEDGVVDLICGYATPEGGAVVLHRGNDDAIFPHTPAARHRRALGIFSDAPFLSPARLTAAPGSPDFLGAGDFNNDGHLDLVTATRGAARIHLLPGTGGGEFLEPVVKALPGAVTAMVVGEIDRPDGLADLVVGVDGREGAAVLVFNSPEGALRGEPELLALPVAATSLMLGRLDTDPYHDLAVGTAGDLLIAAGVGRKQVQARQIVGQIELGATVISVVRGDFVWEQPSENELAVLTDDRAVHILARGADGGGWFELARRRLTGATTDGSDSGAGRGVLLAARMTGLPTEDLVMADASGRGYHLLAGMIRQERPDRESTASPELLQHPGRIFSSALDGAPVAALSMRLNPDALSDLVLLQQGLTAPTTSAPEAYATITVDSDADTTTAGDGRCTLREAIGNANNDGDTTSGDCAAGSGADVIAFSIGGGSSRATIVVNSELPALMGSVTINGNTQGCAEPPCVELDGSPIASTGDGLVLTGNGNTVRGLTINRFPEDGLQVDSSGNVIEGNHVGLDANGSSALPNGSSGIRTGIGADDNTIGGTSESARNVVSGNEEDGIFVYARPGGASGNLILGNYVGTDSSGTLDLGNVLAGIAIEVAEEHTVGGTAPGSRNVISGNENAGILLQDAGTTQVLGNYIGVDVGGDVALGNTMEGVRLLNSSGNTIGGVSAAARNIISGNGDQGVRMMVLLGSSDFNEVLGNYIGTDVTGTSAIGNGLAGVLAGVVMYRSNNNTVGGASPAARNVIAANYQGVGIESADGNEVLGNYIGVDASGTMGLGHEGIGIYIVGDSTGNIIGGTVEGAGNVISDNKKGIGTGDEATGNLIQGNLIGTDASGRRALGNELSGVRINTPDNTVGGAEEGAANLIAYNGTEGVMVRNAGTRSPILHNSIHSNGAVGIDLGDQDGVTPNDPGDADTGPNELQNYPILDQADANPTPDVTIGGSLNSTANRTFRIELFANTSCDPTGYGEGERFLGYTSATTGGDGNVSFSVPLSAPVTDGESITATATDPDDNTSEFSACFAANCSSLAPFAEMIEAAADKSRLEWPTATDIRYAKGDLANVDTYGTTDDGWLLGVTSIDISADNPAAGSGFYYVVKPLGCGSWQTALGAEPDRDTGLP